MMYLNHRLPFGRFTKPLIGLATLFSSSHAVAQNMYWNHYAFYNPAMSGVLNRQDAAITGMYRQYNNQVSSTGYLANYNARVDKLHGGVGVSYAGSVVNGSSLGSSSFGQLNVNYSYHIKTGTNSLLALGVSAGLIHSTIARHTWTPGGISSSRSSDIALNTGLGISYRYKNLNTGLSVQLLNQPIISGDGYHFKLYRSYNFFIDYKWQLSKNLALHPSVMINTSGPYSGMTGTLRAIYKEKYWAGASVSNNGYGFMLGYNFNDKLSIGYSLGVPSYSKATGFGNWNHSLTLRFQLK